MDYVNIRDESFPPTPETFDAPSAEAPPEEHSTISPAILYWGSTVVLVSSLNEDGTTNIAPMSSAFWLGHCCLLGFGSGSKTPQNILRSKQCVLNLADDTMLDAVNLLAGTTGTEFPSAAKLDRGYRYVKDKWACSGLASEVSELVVPLRIKECPVQMECQLVSSHRLMQDAPDRHGLLTAIEVRILRVHVLDKIRMPGHANRIDPDKWRPMILSFQEMYGLKSEKLGPSILGRIPEEKYRMITKSDVVKFPGDERQDAGAAKK